MVEGHGYGEQGLEGVKVCVHVVDVDGLPVIDPVLASVQLVGWGWLVDLWGTLKHPKACCWAHV